MKKIKSITIVGGGSAAWLAATYIQNNFWDIPLTVIDKSPPSPSPIIGTFIEKFVVVLADTTC